MLRLLLLQHVEDVIRQGLHQPCVAGAQLPLVLGQHQPVGDGAILKDVDVEGIPAQDVPRIEVGDAPVQQLAVQKVLVEGVVEKQRVVALVKEALILLQLVLAVLGHQAEIHTHDDQRIDQKRARLAQQLLQAAASQQHLLQAAVPVLADIEDLLHRIEQRRDLRIDAQRAAAMLGGTGTAHIEGADAAAAQLPGGLVADVQPAGLRSLSIQVQLGPAQRRTLLYAAILELEALLQRVGQQFDGEPQGAFLPSRTNFLASCAASAAFSV